MRVVLDTNVLARATPGRSSPAKQLLDFLLAKPHVVIASEYLLDELAWGENQMRLAGIVACMGIGLAALGVGCQKSDVQGQPVDLATGRAAIVPRE
jgi:hypothetical protein